MGAVTQKRRVLIDDIRRDDRYLRVTWHGEANAFVVSHWQGDLCVAATRIAAADTPELVALLARGLGEAAIPHAAARAPERPARPAAKRAGQILARLRQKGRRYRTEPAPSPCEWQTAEPWSSVG